MKKRLQYGVFALIAISLSWFMLSDNDKPIQDISVFEPAIDSQRSEPTSAQEFAPDEVKSKLSNRVIPITSIGELLSLSTGDVVSLKGVSDKGSNEIEISISQLDVQNDYTQMQGTTNDNGIAIITVGVETVNVFIKEASGLYEFSGKGFKGEIPKIEKIVWGDDIYVDPQPTVLEEEPLLAPVEREVQQ
jgi:hypothetical protein